MIFSVSFEGPVMGKFQREPLQQEGPLDGWRVTDKDTNLCFQISALHHYIHIQTQLQSQICFSYSIAH